MWLTLDDIVLQWIYATISQDLLHTIFESDSTIEQAWTRLREIFKINFILVQFPLSKSFPPPSWQIFLVSQLIVNVSKSWSINCRASFYQARSILILEESSLAKQVASGLALTSGVTLVIGVSKTNWS
ncbi:uncharacterized protein LOC124934461 [Impatiens glandulifera]|uniref:uncharacterized protein LOC124934461 n=1 Tax=Impatiens glandulifera TaxID=253017 RepID=UPI001FB15288|nr:uncharacterized protein LOC124934461 [Impatiens glandulifera]